MVEPVATLHDGCYVTTHTALLTYGDRQVEVMRSQYHRIGAGGDKGDVLDVVGIQLDGLAIGFRNFHDILLLGADAETQHGGGN